MLESNNSDPLVCIQNLTRTVKAEVPFSRAKGIDARLIDTPITDVEGIDADVTELIDTYEPRVSADSLSIEADMYGGDLEIKVYISALNQADGESESAEE